jgi:hypothetical protein
MLGTLADGRDSPSRRPQMVRPIPALAPIAHALVATVAATARGA